VPFRHLVNTVQAAQGNFSEICRVLKRTGHQKTVEDKDLLKKQTKRIENWLKNYAPDEWKFTVLQNLPKEVKNLNTKQKEFLGKLAEEFIKQKWEAEKLHNKIYEILKDLNLEPSLAFSAIYISLLGQESGPKAGWFLSVLDKDFVVKRFKQAAK
jgi:lysyl-tRNA synthetase class 1